MLQQFLVFTRIRLEDQGIRLIQCLDRFFDLPFFPEFLSGLIGLQRFIKELLGVFGFLVGRLKGGL